VDLVYFSGVANNTHRFVQKLNLPAHRIPLRTSEPALEATEPYVLLTPTYGGGNDGGAVPKQVIRFLNNLNNRALLRGVIASGNTNFGSHYCLAGIIIANKCKVPLLYKFEILGSDDDVTRVHSMLTQEMEYA
jgi:protein involved in ribonucleotide reduction